MPKRINSGAPAPICWWEPASQRLASRHVQQGSGVSAPHWCNPLNSSAVICEAQGGFTVSWRAIKVQKLQGNEQMLRESRGMPRPDHNWKCLSQKSRSHSHAKGHFLHLAPTPLRWKSILHSAWWVRREYFDYGSADVIQESRGVTHCIRGRDIWLRQVHPSTLWGAWHFQDMENKLPLKKEYAFSVGKKRELEKQGGSRHAHPWLKAHNQGNFCPFRKGESIKMSCGSAADPRHCTYAERNSVLARQDGPCQVTF